MPIAATSWSRTARELLLAAFVGALLQWAANLLVPQLPQPFPGHGERFAAMAAAPLAFAADGDFPQRVLWPALAWLFGQCGVDLLLFSQGCGAMWLAVVFWFARRRVQWLDALLATAAIAASGAVLVYQAMPCFSDQLNLAVMLLLVHFAARPKVFWPLVLLAALSHELMFFFAPWLLGLRLANGGKLRRELGWFGAAVLAYGLYRLPIHAKYGILYYFEHNFWVPWGLPAMWALWFLVVLAEFGPLLVAVAFAARRRALDGLGGLGGRWGPWLYLAGMLPLMVLAYDVMRFAAFVALPVLLGCLALLRVRGGRVALASLLVVQVGFYLWAHPIPSQQGGHQFTIVAAHSQAPDLIPLLLSRTPGDAASYTWQLLLRCWPIALGATLLVGAIFLVGWWIAARLGEAPADDRAVTVGQHR